MKDLERMRDAWLETALEEVGGEGPPDIAGRFLQRDRGGDRRGSGPVTRRSTALAAGVLVAGLLVVFAATRWHSREGSPAGEAVQDPDRDADRRKNPMGGSAFLPLELGASWRYSVHGTGPKPREEEWTITAVRRVGKDRVFQIAAAGAVPGYLYFAADDDGIYRYAVQGTAPGMRPDTRSRVLAAPVGIENEWESSWDGDLRVPPDSVPQGTIRVREQPPPYDVRAELIQVIEPVEVPAGTFDAVHLRAVYQRNGEQPVIEHLWFAREVGLVRRTLEGGPHELSLEWRLREFTPGTPLIDPTPALRRFLAGNEELRGRGAPDAIDWLSLGYEGWILKSRFARVRWEDEQIIVRVFGEEAARFDPERPQDYSALREEEELPEGGDAIAIAIEARTLLSLAGTLHAHMLGCTRIEDLDVARLNMSMNERSVFAEGSTDAASGDGQPIRIEAAITMKAGKVVELQVERAK